MACVQSPTKNQNPAVRRALPVVVAAAVVLLWLEVLEDTAFLTRREFVMTNIYYMYIYIYLSRDDDVRPSRNEFYQWCMLEMIDDQSLRATEDSTKRREAGERWLLPSVNFLESGIWWGAGIRRYCTVCLSLEREERERERERPCESTMR